jgi:hypothetical protein
VQGHNESVVSDSFTLGRIAAMSVQSDYCGTSRTERDREMKHAMTITITSTSILLLSLTVSCREAPKTEETAGEGTSNPTSRQRNRDGKHGYPIDAAKQAFRTARGLYKNGRDYKAAEKGFLTVIQKFARTQYAPLSQGYLHLCRAHRAIAAADWSLVRTELDNTDGIIRNIVKNFTSGSPLPEWTEYMVLHIDRIRTMVREREAFVKIIANARTLYDQGKYNQSGSMLLAAYEDPSTLPNDLQKELKAFKDELLIAGWDGSDTEGKILDALALKASGLYDKKQWTQALGPLKELRTERRGARKYKEMIRTCEFELELIEFNKAFKANNYKKAESSANKLMGIWLDRYETEIEPKLRIMQVKRKIAETLAKGAKALKEGQYIEARKIVDHLKDAYPEAAEINLRSKYLEAKAKGDAAKKKGNLKVAIAMYKIAKRYSKTPAERKKLDALIDAISK